MKKAIVIRAFSGDPNFLAAASFLQSEADFARCFDTAVQVGFEAVQLFVSPKGFFSLESPEQVTAQIAHRARACGVELTSLEIEPFSYLLTDDDAEVRAAGLKTVRRAMEVAAAIGAPGVLLIPGYVGLPWDPKTKPVRYDLAYERTRAALAELAPDAERLGVPILVENIWNKFLLSPLEMRALIDELGSPRVGVLLDTGNVLAFGYPEQWIRILGPRIKEVHLKDFRESVGGIGGFVGLLEGDVNWPEVIAALEEIGYNGFLTAEVFPYHHHPDAVLRHTSQSMDRILGRSST
jgi:L-ribulose-5-phosphate 3-epimerase